MYPLGPITCSICFTLINFIYYCKYFYVKTPYLNSNNKTVCVRYFILILFTLTGLNVLVYGHAINNVNYYVMFVEIVLNT